ncbi:MAG: hypothetical protein PHY45_14775 [Rhodocyclaceae bacterium]|nr:hypothetical protein [Rhodocyclaceae bacterium]
MKPRLHLLLGGLAAALISLGSSAQAGPGAATPQAANPPVLAPCGKARDPARCEALQKAKEACKDTPAANKRKCIMDAMPPMDCSKARNPERCAAVEQAKLTCKDKVGPEYRQCLREHTAKRGAKAPAAPKN